MSASELEHDDASPPGSGAARDSARPSRLRSLPWSDRTILLVSFVVVLLLSPLWLGPAILGGSSSATAGPSVAPASVGPASQQPIVTSSPDQVGEPAQ